MDLMAARVKAIRRLYYGGGIREVDEAFNLVDPDHFDPAVMAPVGGRPVSEPTVEITTEPVTPEIEPVTPEIEVEVEGEADDDGADAIVVDEPPAPRRRRPTRVNI